MIYLCIPKPSHQMGPPSVIFRVDMFSYLTALCRYAVILVSENHVKAT